MTVLLTDGPLPTAGLPVSEADYLALGPTGSGSNSGTAACTPAPAKHPATN